MNFDKKKIIKVIFIVFFLVFISSGVFFAGVKMNKISAQAEVKWDKNADEKVAGYKIYYGTEPRKGNTPSEGHYAASIDAGLTNSFKIKKLSVFKTYYFSTTAYNKAGQESSFSAEVSKQIGLKDIFKK